MRSVPDNMLKHSTAVRKNRKHGHGHEGEVSKHREKVREFFDIASLEKTSRGCSREESLRHEAAREIQRSAMHNGLIAPTIGLNRVVLLERLDLELQLRRGLAQLALCLILFSLVAYSSVLEKVSVQRLGMLNVYKTLFQLDDSLAEIRTIEGLRDYMTEVSVQSHLLQPLSSIYFKDSEGEVALADNACWQALHFALCPPLSPIFSATSCNDRAGASRCESCQASGALTSRWI